MAKPSALSRNIRLEQSTDCHHAVHTTELARHALDAAPDAMIIIDAAGTIRFANRQVSALFGLPAR